MRLTYVIFNFRYIREKLTELPNVLYATSSSDYYCTVDRDCLPDGILFGVPARNCDPLAHCGIHQRGLSCSYSRILEPG